MLKKTLFLIGVFATLTNNVWAHDPFQTSSPKDILRVDTGMPVGPGPYTTRQRMFTLFDPEYLYGDDNRLYCTFENDPMINGIKAPQANDLKEKSTQKKRPEQNWGIAAGLRLAKIPFDTKDDTVMNFIPQLFYEDDLFFMNGLEGGIKITGTDLWRLNALARLRFFDILKSFQNEIQEDTVDMGLQLRYLPGANVFVELELLSDQDFQLHSNVRAGVDLENGDLEWTPYVKFNFKSSDFNDYYYGLDQEDVGAGIDLSAGIDAEHHLISNFYLIGSFQLTYLDHNVRHSTFVDEDFLYETFVGIKFSNERKKSRKKDLRNRPYFRLAHGWATPSNLGEIIGGDTENDKYNNQLWGV